MAPSSQAEAPTHPARPELPRARIVPRPVLDADQRAREIVAAAERNASTILERARGELAALRERVLDEVRKEAASELASRTLALAAKEAELDHRALDRSIDLARVLAERLLGATLTLDPARIVDLAATALAEARGARRIVLHANPEDAALLGQAIAEGRLDHVTRVVPSLARPRGALRIESEIGVLDAEIAPQLDRLIERLRESFPP
jgi:flagellar biosynthesis/type III secretory pathway protein FliH